MFKNMSLGRRLILIVGGINLTIVIAIIVIAVNSGVNILQEQAQQRFLETEIRVTNALEEHLANIATTTENITEITNDLENISPPLLRNAIQETMRNDDDKMIQQVNIYRPGQTVIALDILNPATAGIVQIRTRDNDLADDAWVLAALDSNQAIWRRQDVAIFNETGNSTISLAMSYAREDFEGVIWTDIPLDDFEQLINDTFIAEGSSSDNTSAYSILLDQNGEVLVTHGMPDNFSLDDIPSLSQMVTDATTPNTEATFPVINDPITQKESFTIVSELPTINWQILTVIPQGELPNLPAGTLAQLILIAIFGLALLTWVISRFFERFVTAPLFNLGHAAEEIGAGDLRYYISHQERQDEIGRLSRAMENMKENLSHSYTQLTGWSRKLEERVDQRTEELVQARTEAQAVATELRAIYDESLSVVHELQLEPILQTLMERVLSLLNVNYCSIWLLTSNQKRLQLVATTADSLSQSKRIVIGVDEGIAGQTIQSGEPLMLDDYRNYGQRITYLDHPEIHRALCVPMMFANAPIGVVVVGRDAASPKFTLNDQQLLTLFANMVSPAVRSAQLLVQRDRAVQEAERANQVKTRFLATVTHELRTPLNLVINNMDFMRIGSFGEVNEEQQKRLDQTIRGAEHLLYLINDLLDASKIEAGEMQLHIQPSDVYRVIEDSVDSASLAIEKMEKEERITLQVETEEGLPEVPMDARRIRQVLINLLTNAIKFTQIGEVKLQVSKQGDGIQFVVSDTGMGIPPDEMDLLFEAFERTSEAKSHNIEGTGLGLPISRFLVRSHGGDIDVESTQGEGSTFSFVLPFETPSGTGSKLFDTATKIDTQIMEVLSVKAN